MIANVIFVKYRPFGIRFYSISDIISIYALWVHAYNLYLLLLYWTELRSIYDNWFKYKGFKMK